MKSTAASASGSAGAKTGGASAAAPPRNRPSGNRVPASSSSGNGVCHAEQLPLGGGQRTRGDPDAGPAEDPGPREGAVDADQVAGAGAADGASQPRRAQAGVGNHDHRTQAQAGIDQRGQLDPRGHQQAHPVAGAHPDAGQSARQRIHAVAQLGP